MLLTALIGLMRMTSFIYTPKGYVNLTLVQSAEFTKQHDRHKIVVADTVVDDNNAAFGNTITAVAPISGEWECLHISTNDNGDPAEIVSDPVIAWGLTPLGYVTPITPCDVGGVFDQYGLRKAGDAAIYVNDVRYTNAEAWLAEATKSAHSGKTGTR